MKKLLLSLSLLCLVACGPKDEPENDDPLAPRLDTYTIVTGTAEDWYQIMIFSGTPWTATVDKKWVTIDTEEYNGDASIEITIAEGIDGDTARIVFTNEAGSQTLKIYRRVEQPSNGYFSVGSDSYILFAPGNLQYQATTGTWRFAEHQYDIVGSNNAKISDDYDGWIDLFGWGTGGAPTRHTVQSFNYSLFIDWGANKIGTHNANTWRTATNEEWSYLMEEREDAYLYRGVATVEGQAGLIIFPDFRLSPLHFVSDMGDYSQNIYSAAEWQLMEEAGAIFLPAAGFRYDNMTTDHNTEGYYWTATEMDDNNAYVIHFDATYYQGGSGSPRCNGLSVRLVLDVL